MKNLSLPYPAGPGTQPIRTLQPLIHGQFENASPEFSQTIAEYIEFFETNPKMIYDIAPEPVQSPIISGKEGTIRVQETFLSYLWAITYAHLVVADEDIVRPQIEPNYERSPAQAKLIDDAYDLLLFALHLREEFSTWDINLLPNPELYSEEEAHYIEKSSAVFGQAIVFILVHEFGHLYLGHLESNEPVSRAESRDDEAKADRYAISIMKDGVGIYFNQQTVYCGVIVGLIAVLFFNPTLDGDSHPDPHRRLYSALCELDLEPNDMLWALASAAIVLWAHFFKKPRIGGHDFNSLRENFEKLLAELADPSFFMP